MLIDWPACPIDKSAPSNTLLKVLSAPYPSLDPSNPHPIALPHTSRLYKTLLQGGHFSHSTRTIERAPRWSAREFAVQFVQVVGRDVTVAMAEGDGAFVVAALCEQLAEHADLQERKTVKDRFDAETRNAVRDKGAKGVNVLLESLEKL